MWQRNNGQAEDDLQFRFTAYLVSAVKRRRKDYLIQLYKRSSIESSSEVVYESEPSSEEVVLDKLPLIPISILHSLSGKQYGIYLRDQIYNSRNRHNPFAQRH